MHTVISISVGSWSVTLRQNGLHRFVYGICDVCNRILSTRFSREMPVVLACFPRRATSALRWSPKFRRQCHRSMRFSVVRIPPEDIIPLQAARDSWDRRVVLALAGCSPAGTPARGQIFLCFPLSVLPSSHAAIPVVLVGRHDGDTGTGSTGSDVELWTLLPTSYPEQLPMEPGLLTERTFELGEAHCSEGLHLHPKVRSSQRVHRSDWRHFSSGRRSVGSRRFQSHRAWLSSCGSSLTRFARPCPAPHTPAYRRESVTHWATSSCVSLAEVVQPLVLQGDVPAVIRAWRCGEQQSARPCASCAAKSL